MCATLELKFSDRAISVDRECSYSSNLKNPMQRLLFCMGKSATWVLVQNSGYGPDILEKIFLNSPETNLRNIFVISC